MNESVPRNRTKRIVARAWRILMVLTLLVSALPMAALPVAAQKAQPQLVAMALQQPDSRVQVIVQKQVQDQSVEALLARLGGTVTKDLHIINAIGAQLPARAVPLLGSLPGVRWIAMDGPVASSGKPSGGGGGTTTSTTSNYFLDTLGVRDVWAMGYDGAGIGIAVIDSGIATSNDFRDGSGGRIAVTATFGNTTNPNDNSGHGSHVAGIIAGNGANSAGLYAGIAPRATLLSLSVSDDSGISYESDVVEAMQWVLNNRAAYNIRVVNLSINSSTQVSYHQSAMSAAAEILWFNGIVVVASAGNAYSNYDVLIKSAPAHDPFIITVGATDELGTPNPYDDQVAAFSATGTTLDGHVKPELVAPGKDLVSVLAANSDWSKDYPSRVVDGKYFKASGTSMSAPVVSGAVALLLQKEPGLTPDQVKHRLISTTYLVPDNRFKVKGTAPLVRALNVYAALTATTTASANTGLVSSQLLWTGSEPLTWNSVNWNSVNWNSVNWNSVNWNSVNWNSVNWNSVSWAN